MHKDVQHIPIDEFIKNIKDGVYKIEDNNAFADFRTKRDEHAMDIPVTENLVDYIIESFEGQKDWASKLVEMRKGYVKKDKAEYERTKSEQAERSLRHSEYELEHLFDVKLYSNGMMSIVDFVKVHSYMLDREVYLFLIDGTIRFFKHNDDKDIWSKDAKENIKPDYIPVVVDEKYLRAPVNTIKVPTKKLVIVNRFFGMPKKSDPNRYDAYKDIDKSLEYKKEYGLHGVGMYNRCEWVAKHKNTLYGQMGNMGIGIYANKHEIIITESYLEDMIADGEIVKGEQVDEYTIEASKRAVEAQKVMGYIKKNKLKYKGRLSLETWRYEASDYNDSLKHFDMISQKGSGWYGDKPVVIPVAGTEVEGTHYFRTTEDSPISELVFAHFKVK
jgi:hypothetical protein